MANESKLKMKITVEEIRQNGQHSWRIGLIHGVADQNKIDANQEPLGLPCHIFSSFVINTLFHFLSHPHFYVIKLFKKIFKFVCISIQNIKYYIWYS